MAFRTRVLKTDSGPVVLRRPSRAMPAPGCTTCPRDAGWRFSWVRAAQVALVAILATLLFLAVYYFNYFVVLEQDVKTSAAHVERELQRRVDVVRGIVPAVLEYAALERRVFTEVAKVRSQQARQVEPPGAPPSVEGPPTAESAGPGTTPQADPQPLPPPAGAAVEAPPSAPVLPMEPKAPAMPEVLPAAPGPDAMSELLGRLVAVSEQYPDMKSSVPIKTFMDRIAEIEDRIAAERQKFNDAVNRYTTMRSTFPGRFFALVFRFPDYELFHAEPEARVAPIIEWPPVDATDALAPKAP